MQVIAECLLQVQVEVRLRVIHYSKKMLGTCSQASTAKVRGEKIAPTLCPDLARSAAAHATRTLAVHDTMRFKQR